MTEIETAAIVGVGAIGGYLAVALGVAGVAVTLGVRRPIDALTLRRGDGPARRYDVTCVTEPERLGPHQLVVVATKAHDTRSIAPWLRYAADHAVPVLLAQNGVDHRERLAGVVDPEQVVPALAYLSVERPGPGELLAHAGSALVIANTESSAAIVRAFDPDLLQVRIDDDFTTASWRKLLTNVSSSALTALTDRSLEVLGEPDLRRLAAHLMDEAVRVGRAEGAQLGVEDRERILAGFDAMPPNSGSSMLHDRRAGRPMETEYLTGAVVAAGRRHDLPVPLNEAILALLRAVRRAED
jgi:2-dehydropantoate 2-reductase